MSKVRASGKLGFKVYWDNGANACGTFPIVFDTEEEAEEYGKDWFAQFCVDNDLEPDDDHEAGWEVVSEKLESTI